MSAIIDAYSQNNDDVNIKHNRLVEQVKKWIVDPIKVVLLSGVKTDERTPTDFTVTTGSAKTLVLDTPVYEDLQFPITSGKVPAVNFPTWETMIGYNSAYAFSLSDYIQLQANEPYHARKEATSADMHIHFTNKSAQNSGAVRYVKFSLAYIYANEGEAWQSFYTQTSEFPIPDGTVALTHFLGVKSPIDISGLGIGSQIMIRIARIPCTVGTDYADDIYITQVGMHMQIDKLGSRTIY